MEPLAGEVDSVCCREGYGEGQELECGGCICDQEMFRSDSVFIVFVSLLLFLK